MKKFTCHYLKENGQRDRQAPHGDIEAENAEEAVHIFAEQYPSENPEIQLSWGLGRWKRAYNKERAQQLRLEKEEARAQEEASRIASLKELLRRVESTKGNMVGIFYDDLNALVENMWDFPEIRDELSPEECALREKLFMIASFDKSLQALLQTQEAKLQTSLLNQIASGQPTAGAAGSGKSNLARNVGMMGGIAALQKLNQIEENTGDVSEGLGFD